jgi:hypothetical protein
MTAQSLSEVALDRLQRDAFGFFLVCFPAFRALPDPKLSPTDACGDAEHSGAHLVVEDLKKMAEADGTSLSQVVANINTGAGKDWLERPAEWA